MTKARARELISMLDRWAADENTAAFKASMAGDMTAREFHYGKSSGFNMAIGALQHAIGDTAG